MSAARHIFGDASRVNAPAGSAHGSSANSPSGGMKFETPRLRTLYVDVARAEPGSWRATRRGSRGPCPSGPLGLDSASSRERASR
jgi:hypothetical protein